MWCGHYVEHDGMRSAPKNRKQRGRAVALGLMLAATFPIPAAYAASGYLLDATPQVRASAPSDLCALAESNAETRYGLPPGLLFAISQVESGRPDATTHQLRPWPWTVQAENRSLYFPSRGEAVQWVEQAQSRGLASIDTGCMQVNLAYHPHAFASVDDAFDPFQNADYAARFLVSLHAAAGDWQVAIGQYHSKTLPLAIPYQQRVARALQGGVLPSPPETPPSTLVLLQNAWGATLDTVAPTATGDWSNLKPRPAHRSSVPFRRHRLELLTDAH
jgi:hypothetical protein